MVEGNRWSDRWVDRRGEVREKTNVSASGCVGECAMCMWRDWRKRRTRVAQENEKRRTVFIMLMLCNYSWPWPKIDVDIVGCWVEPRGSFYPLLTLSFSHQSQSSLSFILYIFAQRYACFSIRKILWRGSLEWNGSEGEDRIGTFPIPALHFASKNFSLSSSLS